jgi:hypothetical protein
VSAGLVTVFIGLGAGAIALWIDIRFPRLAPHEVAKAVLHVAASIAVAYATVPAVEALTAADDPRIVLLSVFAVGFPAIVYCLLAGLWVIKLAQRMLGGIMR